MGEARACSVGYFLLWVLAVFGGFYSRQGTQTQEQDLVYREWVEEIKERSMKWKWANSQVKPPSAEGRDGISCFSHEAIWVSYYTRGRKNILFSINYDSFKFHLFGIWLHRVSPRQYVEWIIQTHEVYPWHCLTCWVFLGGFWEIRCYMPASPRES